MAETLHIQLLGEFRIQHGDRPLAEFNSPRLQSLLSYLVLRSGVAQTRQHLAFLFWPDSSDSQARTNLRNALHQLRNILPGIDLCLQIDASSVMWRADAPSHVDIIRFDHLFKQADQKQSPAAQRQLLEQALTLYRGDLLPDCYEEWILPEREEWRQKYGGGLEKLADVLEKQRDYRAAIDLCQRLLKFDPLLESTYTRLMRLHALNGDRAAALRVYHTCMTTLVRELGVEPGPTTQGVYEQLLNLEATPVKSPSSAASAASAASLLSIETSLVGRDAIWQHMQTFWQQAAANRPTLLTISAEAGLGKTRLATELMAWASRQGIQTATAHCYAAGGRLAFAPIVAWLRSAALVQARPPIDPRLFAEAARLLPELLQEYPNLAPPAPVAPQTESWHRQQLFEALARLALPAPQPILLVLDDAHWCDADTLEWVQYLFHTYPHAPLLLLATLRPEETPVDHPMSELQRQLARVGRLQQIELAPLTPAETTQLVEQFAGHVAEHELDESFRRQIYAETEGNPLFILETVRSALDAKHETFGSRQTDSSRTTLPPKIRAIMETRLTRLSPSARDLVAIAALIGRAFTLDILAHVAEMNEDDLLLGLDELWQQRIVREALDGDLGGGMYDFAHDKLREVAHATLSPMLRRMLHRRLASALEELHAAHLDEVAARIALHYEQAGQPLVAIDYYQRAAHFDHRRSAQHEAILHLQRTLELLAKLPASAARDAQELKIQLVLGALLLATRGYADAAVEAAFSRAWALCRHSDDLAVKFQTLWGLERFYLVKPELEKGQAAAQELLLLAHQAEDAGLILEATYAMGTYLFHHGSLGEAQRYLEQTLTLFDRTQHGDHALLYAQDPQVVALTYLALALWCQGWLDQARARSQEAIAIARQIEHPYSLVVALTYAGVLHQFADEAAACGEMAAQANALAQQHGFSLWISMAGFLHGWALAQQGDAQRGLGLMMQHAEGFRHTGAELGSAYSAAMLAQCLQRFGQIDSAQMMMQQSLALLDKTQERLCAAEIQRIQGELWLATQGQNHENVAWVRAKFESALTIAREQNAHWWALRVALSLVHLAPNDENLSAAIQQLKSIVGWFTEGAEQPILQEARAVLQRLKM
ncbi:MAG: BTAD domain-containing putative transcriptional regulator [Caldilineaceae bacterium]